MRNYAGMMVLVAVLASSVLLIGCTTTNTDTQSSEASAMITDSGQFIAFQTTGSIRTLQPTDADVITDALDTIRQIERETTSLLSDGYESDVERINENAGSVPTPVSDVVVEVIQAAQRIAVLSDGAYDPTIGPISSLWNFRSTDHRVPSRDEIDAALQHVGYNKLVLDTMRGEAYLTEYGAKLDLRAAAAGIAADLAAGELRSAGVQAAIIDVGGDILTVGSKFDGSPWRIGLQDPWGQTGDYMGIVELAGGAVGTSGVYEGGFDSDGQFYHEFLDPTTGYPSDTDVVQATVVSESATRSALLSRAFMVMSVGRALAIADSLPNTAAVLITSDRMVHASMHAERLFRITDGDFVNARQ